MSAPANTAVSYGHQRGLPELPSYGTRVTFMFRGYPRHGAVQPYDRQWSHGTFPVRFDDGQWLVMSGCDVILES